MVLKVLLHLLLSFQFCSLEDQCHFDPELFVSDLFFLCVVVVVVIFIVVVFCLFQNPVWKLQSSEISWCLKSV